MKKIIFIGLAIGLSSVSVWAQDQQALQIINQALQAHGGATALLGIQDTIATGQARRFSQTIDQFSVTITTIPGYMREDLTGISMTRTYVKKGDYGWMITNGRRKEIREEDLGNHLDERNPVISFFRLFLQNRFVLQYRGTMTVFGRQVYHLQALLADADAVRRAVKYRIDRSYDVFIDTTTSFFVGYAYYDQSGPRVFTQTTISCIYSDYRPVGGVTFPFKTEIYMNSAKTFEITLTNLSINQGVSLSTFGKSREWHTLNSETQPQTTDASSVGVQPSGSYGGTQESINLYNGNVSIYQPLITLPGRNGFDYKVGLTYNSGGNWWYSLDPGGYSLRGTTNKRWQLIVPTLTWQRGSNGVTWLDRYYITLSDGSTHEMRHIETDDPIPT